MTTAESGASWWLITSFDGGFYDDRPGPIEAEYDGVKLFVKPAECGSQWADQVSVFTEKDEDRASGWLRTNRFLSALSWKDSRGYATVGQSASGCPKESKARPYFNCFHRRAKLTIVRDHFDFSRLQNPGTREQRLALALYRDSLVSNNPFYTFLSFYKIINILHRKPPAQMKWINDNVHRIGGRSGTQRRLGELETAGVDVGRYFYGQARNAIAHAGLRMGETTRDPDDPADRGVTLQDLDPMQELAELLITRDLGVPR